MSKNRKMKSAIKSEVIYVIVTLQNLGLKVLLLYFWFSYNFSVTNTSSLICSNGRTRTAAEAPNKTPFHLQKLKPINF